MHATAFAAFLFAWLSFGCGSTEPSAEQYDAAPLPTTFGGDRPTELRVPLSYDATSTPLPLLVVLHGHSASGLVQLAYSRLGELVDSENVLVLAPDGLINQSDNQYWNATAACCDFYGSGVDDSGYLRSLIDDVSATYNVDPKRIYLWGHSNGGFMAYRMACDHADVIAAVVSLAGAMHLDPANCSPSEPVSVLQIHGDADDTIAYAGGAVCNETVCAYPGAEATLEMWARSNGCSDTRTTVERREDIDSSINGSETSITQQDGCPGGGTVELWTIEGGGHVPVLRTNFDELNWDWLRANPKP